MYQMYLHEIITELREEFPESSLLAFNFHEGERRSYFAEVLCQYDVTVVDYPRHYEGCPVLPLSLIQHFLRLCESWLSLGNHQNVVLIHCERGGWPLLAFVLASFLMYRKLYTGERRTLEMVHREAPKGFLLLLSPLNPFPSQLRYIQYVARRNISPGWPPPEQALTLDCVILRAIPSLDSGNGCRPIVRVFSRNLHTKCGLSTQMIFSMSKKKKSSLKHYRRADADVIKIDIQCLVQGDVVLECVHLDLDPEREVMMFCAMFNTAFIRSNILMLNSENLDILWDSKECYPKGFRVEALFGEAESMFPPRTPTTILNGEEKGGLPIEAFSRVEELFSGIDWVDDTDDALWLLKQISVLSDVRILSRFHSKGSSFVSPIDSEDENHVSSTVDSSDEAFEFFSKSSLELLKLNIVDLVPTEDYPHSANLPEDDLVKVPTETSLPSLHHVPLLPIEEKLPSLTPQSPTLPPPLPYSLALAPHASSIEYFPVPPPPPDYSNEKMDLPFPNKVEDPPPSPFPPRFSSKDSHVQPHVDSPHPPLPPPFSSTSSLSSLPPSAPPSLPPLPLSSLMPTVTRTDKLKPSPPPPPPPPPMPSSFHSKSSGLVLQVPAPSVNESINAPKASAPPSPLPPPPSSSYGNTPRPRTPPPHSSSVNNPRASLPPPSSSSSSATLKVLPAPPPPPPCSSNPAPRAPPSPPPPPPPISSSNHASRAPPAPPPPPPPSSISNHAPKAPPPPPPPPLGSSNHVSKVPPPPPPPPLGISNHVSMAPPPPPPPPPSSTSSSHAPRAPPPPPPSSSSNHASRAPHPTPPPPPSQSRHPNSSPLPPPPTLKPPTAPPPPTCGTTLGPSPPPPPGAEVSNVPPPPLPSAGRGKASLGSIGGRGQGASGVTTGPKRTTLKPLHWVKLSQATQGSLWANSQKQENLSKAPEINISELESLFSAASTSDGSDANKPRGQCGSNIIKPKKVQLVDLRRAYNCEIMLTKIKVPLPDITSAILALDSSALDMDQVENLIKFCPTKEEMETLKNYKGEKEMLGKCEQFFMELMKVPRVEAKLRVFVFKINFTSQVDDLRRYLNTINSVAREVKDSVKLRQIMQTILTLGNALNQGTARGSAIGFKLDSLLKLSDTRARNNKMTMMHYLCKLLSEKKPELLDFDKDLIHLEAASKIQLKTLAEEMQAVSKGLEKVEQELTASENDGITSAGFQKVLKGFLNNAEAEVRSLISLYSEVGRNVDSLSQYFGEDPARCPFEQVTQILVVFVKMFNKSREENERQAEAEKKKLEKEAMKERAFANASAKKDASDLDKFKIGPQTLKNAC